MNPARAPFRSLGLTTLGLCSLVNLGLADNKVEVKPSPSGAFVVSARTGAGLLRVGAVAGDFGLRNSQVTAVVRKADGWLVDFWPNQRRRASAPQLADADNVDGIWQLAPVIHDGRRAMSVRYTAFTHGKNALDAEANLSIAGAQVRLKTRYELVAEKPELSITSELSHLGGGQVHLKFQETLKWGNADYWVENVPEPLSSFNGSARWIGRHGASGDLKWTRLDAEPFLLQFQQSHPGLAPQIEATYALVVLAPGTRQVFSRALAYESIPPPPLPQTPEGKLRVSLVDEAGQALPSKLTFSGLGATPNPNFGNDGNEAGANRFVWSGTGHFERSLPVGSYRVMATSGPERAAETFEVRIEPNRISEHSGRLPRLIETPGWLSGDLHLHQVESVDADLSHSARLLAVAAEGLELAVASDHYTVTDFAPTVAELVAQGRLARPLSTIVGSEVSTVGHRFGHFNLFPMELDDFVNYADTTPKALFAEMRKVAPDAVLQVNHPRWPDIGYFQAYKMDPKTHRIWHELEHEYADDFDALEVFNGLDAYSHPRVRMVLRDWIALLGRGHRYTATGNSDSHKLAIQDPGVPRNLIRHGLHTNDAQDPLVPHAKIIEGIKHGRVLVTNGPIIDVKAGELGPGDTVHSGGKPVTLEVSVRAVPWVDVSHVEVLVGPSAQRLRYIPVPPSMEVVRYREAVKVPGYAKTFVIVVVAGKKPLANVYSTGIQPLAFTNPIWIEP